MRDLEPADGGSSGITDFPCSVHICRFSLALLSCCVSVLHLEFLLQSVETCLCSL
jgi:hypothetical protein